MIARDFEKNLVKTAQGILLPVRVTPGCKEFAVSGFDEWTGSLKVRLREKPEKGKANKELLENFEKIFNTHVEIIAGEKQREKKLLVFAPAEKVIEHLSRLLGNNKT
jgi:hypothetical protein